MLKVDRAIFKMLTVSIDGNISSGKSTLVTKLLEKFSQIAPSCTDVEIIPEPLDKWCSLRGHNLLGMFYEDPVKNNFIFQHYVQLTRLMDTVKNLKEKNGSDTQKIRLMERSLQNNRYCFTELARKEGNLKDAEFAVLVEWYNWLEKNLDLNLDVIVYLKTTPEVVYSRMKSRGRTEESTVPLSYLSSLHETYEQWLVHQNPEDPSRRQKVIVIDANKSKEEVFAQTKDSLTEYLLKFRQDVISPNGFPSLGSLHTPA